MHRWRFCEVMLRQVVYHAGHAARSVAVDSHEALAREF